MKPEKNERRVNKYIRKGQRPNKPKRKIRSRKLTRKAKLVNLSGRRHRPVIIRSRGKGLKKLSKTLRYASYMKIIKYFQFSRSTDGFPIFMVHNVRLPSSYISWDVATSLPAGGAGVTWQPVPARHVSRGPRAVWSWALSRGIRFLGFTHNGLAFYAVSGVPSPSKSGAGSKPSLRVEIFDVMQILQYLQHSSFRVDHGYITFIVQKDGKKSPLPSYYVRKDQPPGAGWKYAGQFATQMDGIEACRRINKPLVALRSLGNVFKCWCARKRSLLTGLETTQPSTGGYIQIIDISWLLESMLEESTQWEQSTAGGHTMTTTHVVTEQQTGVIDSMVLTDASKRRLATFERTTLPQGYNSFTIQMPGGSQSDLATFYPARLPSSALRYPFKEAKTALDCVSSCFNLRFSHASLVTSADGQLAGCECVAAADGATLKLTNTKRPAQAGARELVRLPANPGSGQTGSSDGSTLVGEATTMAPGLVRLILFNEPQPVGFSTESQCQERGVRIAGTSGPFDCAFKCFSGHYAVSCMTKSQCFCADAGAVDTTPRYTAGRGVASVFNINKFLPKPTSSGGASFSSLTIPETNYVRLLLNNAPVPTGFTGSSRPPPGFTAVPGTRPDVLGCSDACDHSPYVAVLAAGPRRLSCWCGKSFDMTSLKKRYPGRPGQVQVFDFREANKRMMTKG